MIAWFLAGGVAVGLGVLLWAERRDHVSKWVAKPAASACFVALGLIRMDDVAGAMVVAGLAFGMAGDVLLLSQRKRWFLAGLGSFLVGHLLYVAAFVQAPLLGDARWYGAGALALLTGTGAAVWLRPHVAGALRGAVFAYIVTIMLLLQTAWGHAVPWQAAVGAGLFAVSDLAVARNRFVAPGFVNRVVGLPLYYAGQTLIAWSL